MSNFSNLIIGEEFKLSFGLSISGTSKQPNEVRFSVGTDPKYSVLCVLNSSTEYEANITLPKEFENQSVEISIEVNIGGRIFIPYKENISFGSRSDRAKQFNNELKTALGQNDPELDKVTDPNYEIVKPSLEIKEPGTKSVNPLSIEDLLSAAKRYVPQPKVTETKLTEKIFDIDEIKDIGKKAIKSAKEKDPELYKKVQDYMNQVNTEVRDFKQPVKEKQQIKFTKPKKVDKIIEPIKVDFSELSEQTKDIKPIEKEQKVIIKENKISLFKIKKTKIVEK